MGVGDDIAPRFTQKPVLKQEDNGNRLVFHCTLEASPKPDIQWFQGTTPINQSDRIKMRVEPSGGNKYNVMMDIIGVGQGDAGTYKVTAKNKLGEVSASINLNFSGAGQKQQDGIAPNFTQKPVTKQANNGRTLLFECQLTADPAPQIAWSRDDHPINAGGRIKMKTDSQGNKKYFVVLEIDNVSAQDAGNYRVTAKNALGESNATIRLNFDSDDSSKQQGQPPKFTQKPVIKQVGNNIVFECKLTAEPKPTITWFQGTKVLKEDVRHKITHKQNKTEHELALEIVNVSQMDGGEYKVNAKNSLGESNATITLNFEGKKPKLEGKAPHFLQKPTIKQEGGMLVMTCNLEAKPQPGIKWFRENKEISSGGRNTITITKDSGANDNFTAKFQIKGVNLVIDCKCTASPKPTISWQRENKPITEGPKYKMRTKENGTNNFIFYLDILNFKKEDGGVYKITAKNDAGEGNASITINLEGAKEPKEAPPQLKGVPTIKLEDGGKRLVVEQKIISKSKPTAMWYFGNKPIKAGGRYFLDVAHEEETFVIVMEISMPTDADSGDYKCVIKNPGGEVTATSKINLKALQPKVVGDAPKFTQKLSPKNVTDGDAVDFVAKVTGTEPIEVKWSKNKKPIASSDVHKISYDKGTCRLYISEVFPEDSGEYTVEVKNKVGSAMSMASLQVKEKPKPKEKPEEKKEEKKVEQKKVEEKKVEEKKAEEKKAEEKKVEEKKAEEKKVEEKKAEEKKVEEKKAEEKKVEEKKVEQKKEEPKDKSSSDQKGGDYETQGPRRISVSKGKGPAPVAKIEGPTHTMAKKPENIVLIEGDDLSVKIPVDVQDGVPEPKIRFYKGNRELKNDSRVTITEKPFGSILQIKKTRFPDEAKYTAVLEQGGTPVDQATFSVFIKDPKDSALDFRALLKHREHGKKAEEDDDIDWGTLKPETAPMDKKRRPSQIEMMKANLKKVEKVGSDSEDERILRHFYKWLKKKDKGDNKLIVCQNYRLVTDKTELDHLFSSQVRYSLQFILYMKKKFIRVSHKCVDANFLPFIYFIYIYYFFYFIYLFFLFLVLKKMKPFKRKESIL
ncbi:hypothetical protein KUTeg_023757 [Tegillarca granosa]|uniref:Ig-like domain-containing protein n=1 Tax=Tegillarca granosa TaxID=220873 RepID=A0ABQ9E812_TEGGR|nr:hypothetical protein KUTeg_023757 [Tegillarca granosa]